MIDIATREVAAMLRDAVGNRRMPPGSAVESADYLWRRGFPFHARKRLAGHRLVATDADWRAGEGAEISGPIQALVMLLAGRTAVVAELTGI